MKKLCYIIALILCFTWGIAFFIAGIGMVIHSVLMIAVVIYLHGVICNPGTSPARQSAGATA